MLRFLLKNEKSSEWFYSSLWSYLLFYKFHYVLFFKSIYMMLDFEILIVLFKMIISYRLVALIIIDP